MIWTPGTRVGPYEITAALGAGGMGEVYRAHDARLRRDVALKVLPASLVDDADRRARFEREARVLASLSHPNIAAIHGLEEASGAVVLVLEFVDGRTLADRIAAGPVPVDEALAIALQIAEGLEAAHEQGIIHRDLKPANVQIAPDGKVKILDFGLAKALDPLAARGAADSSQSPTITSAPTQLGVVLGTAAYMAPEQARGKTVDRRADIWAFGALLFEMLSARRAFPGETISDTIAAVLTHTPEWNALPPKTPAALRTLIMRCLERDPRQRLQSIGEARIVLTRPDVLETATISTRPRSTVPVALAATFVIAAALLAGAVAWWMLRNGTASATAPVRRFDIAADGLHISADRPPVLSPDGSYIAYAAAGSLWIRSTADFNSKQVNGSAEGTYPAWSPDGKQFAFIRKDQLFRVPVDGGEPQLVGPVPPDMAGSGALVWKTDGNFFVVGSDTQGITEISAHDGRGREVVPLDRKSETDFHELALLPDGSSVLYTAHTTQGIDTIRVLVNGVPKDVLKIPGDNLRAVAYHPAGYLLFGRETIQRGVWAVQFSLSSLKTEGDPFLVDPAASYPCVSNDGTVSMVRPSNAPSDLAWIDRAGSMTTAGALTGRVPDYAGIRMMRLSPDGERVAAALEDEVWVFDLKRGVASPLVRGVQRVVWPTWLPGGGRVLFAAFVGSRAWSVQSVSANESSTPQRVLPVNDEFQWPYAVSPDGRWFLFGRSISPSTDVWIAPFDRPAEAKPLMVTPSRESDAQFSPDGRWLSYLSDESGRMEAYVRRFPIGDDRARLSNGGAASLNWSQDSREVFYRSGSAIMSVQLAEKDGRIEPSSPERLFTTPDATVSESFVAAPDGRRFLFARARGNDRIGIILNWAASLK